MSDLLATGCITRLSVVIETAFPDRNEVVLANQKNNGYCGGGRISE